MYIKGDPDREPLCTGGEPAEYFAGVSAWVAVLAAVAHRELHGLAVSGGGIYLSTSGNFSTSGLSGADEDVFLCNTAGIGTNTSCSSFTLLFDGTAYGLDGNDIFAFDLP